MSLLLEPKNKNRLFLMLRLRLSRIFHQAVISVYQLLVKFVIVHIYYNMKLRIPLQFLTNSFGASFAPIKISFLWLVQTVQMLFVPLWQSLLDRTSNVHLMGKDIASSEKIVQGK